MLVAQAKQWKQRLKRMDLLAAEMGDTPGAELLTSLARDAARKITQMHKVLDKIVRKGREA